MTATVREQILATKADLPYEEIEVEEWGGVYRVRVMTGVERDQLELAVQDPASGRFALKNWRARLVVLTLCDETGNRIFKDEDIEAVGNLNGMTLTRVAEVAMRVNGLTAEALEDARKN